MTSAEYKEQLSEALGKLAGVHAVGDTWITFDGSIPVGGVPFTGQLVTRAMYADLWAWVQANKAVVTDSEWQTTANAQNGMNAAYSSGDGSTTFRLPCAVGGYLQVGDTSTAGQYVKEGLPDIEGSTMFSLVADNSLFFGAFLATGQAAHTPGVAMGANTGLGFRASNYNTTYGNSDHVTPETFKVLVGVYAFGVAGSIGEATEEGIVAEMNHKADIDASNFSTAGKNVLAGMGMPSGRYVDLALGANGSRYTAPANGWFTITKVTENAGEMVGFASTSTEQRIITYGPSYNRAWVSCYMPALKGHEVIAEYNATGATQFFRFIYAEGATDEAV